jgi:hypothetical protein
MRVQFFGLLFSFGMMVSTTSVTLAHDAAAIQALRHKLEALEKKHDALEKRHAQLSDDINILLSNVVSAGGFGVDVSNATRGPAPPCEAGAFVYEVRPYREDGFVKFEFLCRKLNRP